MNASVMKKSLTSIVSTTFLVSSHKMNIYYTNETSFTLTQRACATNSADAITFTRGDMDDDDEDGGGDDGDLQSATADVISAEHLFTFLTP